MSYIFYLSRLENLNVTHQCKCLYILRHQRTRKYFNFTKTRLHRSAICVSSHLFCIFAIFFIHSLYKYFAFQAMNTECQRHSKKKQHQQTKNEQTHRTFTCRLKGNIQSTMYIYIKCIYCTHTTCVARIQIYYIRTI